jgi:hypothetical protein
MMAPWDAWTWFAALAIEWSWSVGAVWPLANHSEALAWRIRPRLAHWIRSFRGRQGGLL